jgi:hypothetical protein
MINNNDDHRAKVGKRAFAATTTVASGVAVGGTHSKTGIEKVITVL